MNIITEKGAINMPYVLVGIRKDHLTDFYVIDREKVQKLSHIKETVSQYCWPPFIHDSLTHLDSLFI